MKSKRLSQHEIAGRLLPPPQSGDSIKRALRTYAGPNSEEGRRVRRSTGRDVQFATIVTPEFKDWIKSEAKARGKRMCVLLEDMRDAYKKINSGR